MRTVASCLLSVGLSAGSMGCDLHNVKIGSGRHRIAIGEPILLSPVTIDRCEDAVAVLVLGGPQSYTVFTLPTEWIGGRCREGQALTLRLEEAYR